MSAQVESFLQGPVARAIRLPGKVVLRRSETTLDRYRRGVAEGSIQLDGPEVCELVVGGVVIASGVVVQDDDGEYYFKVRKEEIDE